MLVSGISAHTLTAQAALLVSKAGQLTDRIEGIQKSWSTKSADGYAIYLDYAFMALVGAATIVFLSKLLIWMVRKAQQNTSAWLVRKVGLDSTEARLLSQLAATEFGTKPRQLVSSLRTFDLLLGQHLRKVCAEQNDYGTQLDAFKKLRNKIVAKCKDKVSGLPGVSRVPVLSFVEVLNLAQGGKTSSSCRLIQQHDGKIRLVGLGVAERKSWKIGDLLEIRCQDVGKEEGPVAYLAKFSIVESYKAGLFLVAFDFPCETVYSEGRDARRSYSVALHLHEQSCVVAQLETITSGWAHLLVPESVPIGRTVRLGEKDGRAGWESGAPATVIYTYPSPVPGHMALGLYFPESSGSIHSAFVSRQGAKP